MKYKVKPIVCDHVVVGYSVIRIGTLKIVCICNIKRNAELIADILNADDDESCAYSYDFCPYAKYRVIKTECEG